MEQMDKPENHQDKAEYSEGSENRKLVEWILSKSSAERVGFLVSAGINTKDGKLTKQYRD